MKLRRKVATLNQKVNRAKKKKITVVDKDDRMAKKALFKLCDDNLSKEMADIVRLSLSTKKKQGRRYSKEVTAMGISIYNISPKCYKHLRNFFVLPSPTTLKRTTSKWKCDSGLNDLFLNAFASKLQNASEDYRNCIISIDEMSLKTHLNYSVQQDKITGLSDFQGGTVESKIENHASVLMARGLFDGWTQPVSYWIVKDAFKAEDLKTIVEDCVRKLRSIGLIIRGFESDMGPNFQKFARLMGVSPENPYFYVDDSKIYYIHDVPHLFKCTRNCLLKKSIKVPAGDSVSWEYFSKVYELDKKLHFRLLHKLTDCHLNPSNKEKMRVKYAVQVLSSTMAACINTYISVKRLPEDAMTTADFTSKFDGLFDMLNSAVQFHESKPLKSGFSGTTEQSKYLKDMKTYISSLKVINDENIDVTKQQPFLRGWLITISAVECLWEDLKNMDGVEFLATRRLNQDPIENFFGKIRQNCGTNLKPTVEQFIGAFKKCLYQAFLPQGTIEGTNCEVDHDYFLFNGDEVLTADQNTESNEDPIRRQNTISQNGKPFSLFSC